MKHTKNRVAALLLALAMVLSLMPMAFAADEYPDMPAEDDPSYAAVKSAIDNKIMTGENGELKLEGTILRSTVSKMVVTAFAAKGEADLSGYPDVDSEAWYAAWMAKANQMGIMTGTSGKMNPSNEVTLAEVAAMLVRALGLPLDKDAKLEGVADWAAPYIKALIDAGYLDAEDAAKAGEPMSRGAFAEVIYKVSGEGNYVSEGEITEDVDGNLVITGPVSLKGITVKGDIIIADGVDADSIVLDDVTVEGRLVVRGAKEVSLTNGTTAAATVVAKTADEVTLKADTTSDAGDIAVAGTNGKAADKVTLDMAEPKATVTVATDVAVQNAEGGEVTLAADVKLTVESGTVASVTVADGAKPAVEVAKDAAIEKVTTNSDLTITGEGTVTEKAGSGTVTDAEGNEVAGSDEPADVPSVNVPSLPTEQPPEQEGAHTHNYDPEGTVTQLNATHHLVACVDKEESAEGAGDGVTGCGAVVSALHTFGEDGACTACGYSQKVTTTPGEEPDGTGTNYTCGNHGNWTLDEDEDNSEPDCTTEGVKHYVCGNKVTVPDPEGGEGATKEVACTATKTVTTPALGHNYTMTSETKATCAANGAQVFTCSVCEEGDTDHTKTVTIAKESVAHTLVRDTTTDVKATCATEGKEGWKCSVEGCSYTQLKNLGKNPNTHTWSAWAVDDEDETKHSRTCTNGAHESEVKETSSHTWTQTAAAVAPTCTSKGSTAAQKCSVCNKGQAAEEIAATGEHVYAAAWTSDATQHWHKCVSDAKCTEIEGEKENHKWSDGDGTSEGAYCVICKYVKTGGSGTPEQPGGTHQHTAGSWVTTNDTHHWKTCTGDNCPGANDNSKLPNYGPHSWAGKGGENSIGQCECGKQCTGDHSGTTEGSSCSTCGWSYKAQGTPG